MSIFEYNAEEELKKLRTAERQGGFEDGFAAGEDLGRTEGRAEGRAEGRTRGAAEAVLTVLEELGQIPEEVRLRVTEEQDIATLKRWLKEAVRAETIAEFSAWILTET